MNKIRYILADFFYHISMELAEPWDTKDYLMLVIIELHSHDKVIIQALFEDFFQRSSWVI